MSSVESKHTRGFSRSFRKTSSSLMKLGRRLAGRKVISEETRMMDLVEPMEHISPAPYLSSEEIDYPKAPTPQQICLVQETWEAVRTSSFEGDGEFTSPALCFIRAFYTRLFSLEPSTVQLFNNNFVRQANALAGMLQVIVIKLDNADDPKFGIEVKELGARHVHYGVKPDKLPVLAPSVDYALRDRLRGKYTLEIGQAWRCAIAFLTHVIKQGMIEEMRTLGYTDIESPPKQPSCTVM